MFEAVFPLLNAFARMPVCGLISEYNNFGETSPKWAGKMMRAVLTKRLTIRGFIVSDFAARHGDFLRDMSQWVREGKVKHKEFVTEGLDSAPGRVHGPFEGRQFRQAAGARRAGQGVSRHNISEKMKHGRYS